MKQIFEEDLESSNKMLPSSTSSSSSKKSQTYLNWSILNLILSIFCPFSLCFNIVSFKYSFKVKHSNQINHFKNAKRYSKLAKNFNIINTSLNLIGFLFILIVLIKYFQNKSIKQQQLGGGGGAHNLTRQTNNYMKSIIGIWKLKTSDNKFEQYLIDIGVNYFIRKIALNINPTIEFQFDNKTNEWTCKGSTAFKVKIDKFQLNTLFRDETFDIWSWSSFKLDSNNKLIKYQWNDKNELFSMISFELTSDDKLLSISKSNNTQSFAYFERIDFNDYE